MAMSENPGTISAYLNLMIVFSIYSPKNMVILTHSHDDSASDTSKVLESTEPNKLAWQLRIPKKMAGFL